MPHTRTRTNTPRRSPTRRMTKKQQQHRKNRRIILGTLSVLGLFVMGWLGVQGIRVGQTVVESGALTNILGITFFLVVVFGTVIGLWVFWSTHNAPAIRPSEVYESTVAVVPVVSQSTPAKEPAKPKFNAITTLEQMYALTPTEFEAFVAFLFSRNGYRVEFTPRTGDRGVDLYVYKDGTKAVVQCKRYATQVNPEKVRELCGTMQGEHVTIGYFVTTGRVTIETRAWAFGKGITIIEGMNLVAWVNGHDNPLQR